MHKYADTTFQIQEKYLIRKSVLLYDPKQIVQLSQMHYFEVFQFVVSVNKISNEPLLFASKKGLSSKQGKSFSNNTKDRSFTQAHEK